MRLPAKLGLWLLVGLLFLPALGLAQDLDDLTKDEKQPGTEVTLPGDSTTTPGTPATPPTLPGGKKSVDDLLTQLKIFWENLLGGANNNLPGTFPGTGPGTVPGTVPVTPPSGNETPPTPGTGDSELYPAAEVPWGTPDSDTEYEKRGKSLVKAIKDKGTKPGVGKGDSEAAPDIPGFPQWFCDLQNLLCGSRIWGDEEEKARQLIRDFAIQWASQNLPQPTFHSLPYFFRYLGCTQTNDFPLANYAFRKKQKLPRAGDLGGETTAKNWCAYSSNMCYSQPILDAGFKVDGGRGAVWATKTKYFKQVNAGDPEYKLEPGDYISTGEGGHAMTVVQARGDRVLVVSGNAGGGYCNGQNTVRLEERKVSDLKLVKKFSALSLTDVKAHENDPAWLKGWGISK